MKTKFNTKQLVLLGLLTAIVMVFSFTTIGSIPIGPLVITLNVIPIAIAAVALGPIGGLIMGSVFGIFSFLQCFGIGVLSGMGAVLVDINPVLAFIQRFVPRALDGFLVGLIYNFVSRKTNVQTASLVTGFCTAFLNTLLFMSALVLLFGNTDYVQGLMDGKNVLIWIVTFVGINALLEMVICTIVTGAVGAGLKAAGMIKDPDSSKKPAENKNITNEPKVDLNKG